jgi:hypothetical protein
VRQAAWVLSTNEAKAKNVTVPANTKNVKRMCVTRQVFQHMTIKKMKKMASRPPIIWTTSGLLMTLIAV